MAVASLIFMIVLHIDLCLSALSGHFGIVAHSADVGCGESARNPPTFYSGDGRSVENAHKRSMPATYLENRATRKGQALVTASRRLVFQNLA